jgi:hypothetical protein
VRRARRPPRPTTLRAQLARGGAHRGRRGGCGPARIAVRRITGKLAGLAERTATEAERLLGNARRALRATEARAAALAAAGAADPAAGRRRGRLRRAVNGSTT